LRNYADVTPEQLSKNINAIMNKDKMQKSKNQKFRHLNYKKDFELKMEMMNMALHGELEKELEKHKM
jgi:hypothetical protein